MNKFLIIALIALLGLNGFLLNKLGALYAKFEKIDKSIENLSAINNQKAELKDINRLIFESNFKDNLILNNFNLTTGIILGFFTILIGLGVYLSFQRIDDEIEKLKGYKTEIDNIAKDISAAKINMQSKIEESLSLTFLSYYQEISIDYTKLNFYYNEKRNSPFESSEIFRVLASSIIKLNAIKSFSNTYGFTNNESQRNITNMCIESENCIIDTLELTNNFLISNKKNFTSIQKTLLLSCSTELKQQLKMNDFPNLKKVFSKFENTLNQNTH